MSARERNEAVQHDDLAEALRDAPPRMDDLRRARLERRVLARARGASSSQEIAPSKEVRRTSSARTRVVGGALALAAAALVGFVVRGMMVPSDASGPRFAVGSAFETREGTLTNGSRVELASGEEGRLAIGDVTAQLREGGALEVRSVDPDDVRLVLDRGTAELAFHPHARGRQHLRVVTPSADVEVVGTIFTVRVDDAGTSVSVREGTVRVTRRSGEPVLVRAGESVTVPRLVTADARATEAPPSDPQRAGLGPAVRDPLAPAPVPVPLLAQGAEASVPAPLSFRAPRSARPHADGERVEGVETESSAAPGGELAVASSTSEASGGEPGVSEGASVEGEVASGAAASGDLTAVHPAVPVDGWAAHRPSSREIASAWHDIDELQAQGQYERSLGLLVRLERYAPPSDQDEALFDRARTVQEALRRTRAARALYSEYVRRFPEGRHVQEVRRRLVALGASAEGDPVEAPAP